MKSLFRNTLSLSHLSWTRKEITSIRLIQFSISVKPLTESLGEGPLCIQRNSRRMGFSSSAGPPLQQVTTKTLRQIEALHEKHLPIPDRVKQLRLPPLPMGLDIRYLDLSARSYHCLTNRGVSNFGKDLSGLKLGELLKIKGFGVISLIDVLTALEPRSFKLW